MTANRRQHHNPQTHLRHFAAGDRLRVFKRPAHPQQAPESFETSTQNVANERDLYTIVTEDGARDFKLDDGLQAIEKQLNKALAPLSEDRNLTAAEFADLQVLAAIQDGRKPNSVHGLTRAVGEIHAISRYLYSKHAPHLTDGEIDDRLREQWGPTKLSGAAALDPKNLALTVLSKTVFEFPQDFVDIYHPCLVTTNAQDFMTGDAPVVYFDPTLEQHPFLGFDRSLPTIEVTFPLTRRHLLFMSHLAVPRHVVANKTAVAMLNNRTAYGCRQIYAFPTVDARAKARQLMDIKSPLGSMNITSLILCTLISDAGRAEIGASMSGGWARLTDVFRPGRQ